MTESEDWTEYMRLVAAGVAPDSAATVVYEARQRRIFEQNLALARRSHHTTDRARAAKRRTA